MLLTGPFQPGLISLAHCLASEDGIWKEIPMETKNDVPLEEEAAIDEAIFVDEEVLQEDLGFQLPGHPSAKHTRIPRANT